MQVQKNLLKGLQLVLTIHRTILPMLYQHISYIRNLVLPSLPDQTVPALGEFQENGFPASNLTRSDLALRDIDILREMNGVTIRASVTPKDSQIRNLFAANRIDTAKSI